MDESPLSVFATEWVCYLIEKGHGVLLSREVPPVFRSVHGDERYRWLLLCAEEAPLLLTPIEHEHVERERRMATRAGEAGFLAVKFEQPVTRVIVLPLQAAAGQCQIDADKGGIDWDW